MKLAFYNVLRATFLKTDVDLADPMHEKHKIGAERAIDQKFAAPMTVLALLAQKILLRPRNHLGDLNVSRRVRVRLSRFRAWQCNNVSR